MPVPGKNEGQLTFYLRLLLRGQAKPKLRLPNIILWILISMDAAAVSLVGGKHLGNAFTETTWIGYRRGNVSTIKKKWLPVRAYCSIIG